jgi:hypothetical protein
MALIDRTAYDHPEHFDDQIREYRTSRRYVPTSLENLLYELAGHRCTICGAPWMEIHHIDELGEGGETVYENLIVLCPNCHTRVHSEGVPSKNELRHYKRKQEISYELPILSRLGEAERRLILEAASLDDTDLVLLEKQFYEEIEAKDQAEAVRIARRRAGYLYLEESGIVACQRDLVATLENGTHVSVALVFSLTGKGVKWIRYLRESDRLAAFA